MAKQYKVVVSTGKEENNKTVGIAQFSGDQGLPVRLKAQAGAKYQLQEITRSKLVGPDYIKVKRVGKNLHVLFEDENQASLIIEDYYSEMAPGYNGVIGQAENGSFYEYIPEDPRVPGLIPELAEGGQAVNVALGGAEVTPVGAAVAIAAFPVLGALGILGAGAAVVANNTDTASPSTTPVPAPEPEPAPTSSQKTAITIDPVTGDNIVTTDEAGQAVTQIRGKVTGKFAPGDLILLSLNGNTYTTLVDGDGTYSTFVATADLRADPDGKIKASVAGTGGETASAAQSYVFAEPAHWQPRL